MFVLSKLMSAMTQPLFWLALWWALALVLLGLTDRWRRAALRMLCCPFLGSNRRLAGGRACVSVCAQLG